LRKESSGQKKGNSLKDGAAGSAARNPPAMSSGHRSVFSSQEVENSKGKGGLFGGKKKEKKK